MSRQEVWLQFDGAKQVATWLLNTSKGLRFLNWFLKKYFRKIMATAAGYELYEQLRKDVQREIEADQSRPLVVIETHPDGFMRVYGNKVSVTFVNRIATEFQSAEALDEERCWIECNAAAREVYLDDRKLIAHEMLSFHATTIQELVNGRARKEMCKAFSQGVVRNRSDAPVN